MARAFALRFKGREPETVDRIKFFGHREFCRQEFGDENKGGEALDRWFKKQPGCENDSIYHYFPRYPSMQDLPILQQCSLAIIKEREQNRKLFAQKDAELEALRDENNELREQIRDGIYDQWRHLKDFHKLCTENAVEEAEI